MATFVLVPGAWLGGWVWRRVADPLRALGHTVYTPTLTGLGERSHLSSPSVSLVTHVRDVLNLFEYEDLYDVVLVGHSWAGMVVTGVADRLPERVRRIVYVDAVVPRHGRCLLDEFPSEVRREIEEVAYSHNDAIRMPPDLSTISAISDMSADDLAWMRSKAVAQPLATWSETLHLGGRASDVPRSYVVCTLDRTAFPPYVGEAKASPEWRYHEISTGHWPMITKPAALAEILHENG